MRRETRRWLSARLKVLRSQGITGEEAKNCCAIDAVFTWVAASALKYGDKFLCEVPECVIIEHYPMEEADWDRLLARVIPLVEEGWVAKYNEILDQHNHDHHQG